MDSGNSATDNVLPSFSVNTGRLPRNEAFSLWQEEIVPYWEVRPFGKNSETLESATEGDLIGDMVLGKVRTPSQRISRSPYRIARDGLVNTLNELTPPLFGNSTTYRVYGRRNRTPIHTVDSMILRDE